MKKALCLVVISFVLSVCAGAAFEKVNKYSDNFSDVSDTSWYSENVKTAYELGFMNGKSEGKFDPDGNVTVAEGVTLASRLYASYRDVKIISGLKEVAEYRFDFDDPSILVDLSKRNSRNINGINLNHATGFVENGVLVLQPDEVNANNSYDPQIKFEGLDLFAREYNNVKIRMKRDALPNPNPEAKRVERLEFFFETTVNQGYNGQKLIYINLPTDKELSEWFEVEAYLGGHDLWTDIITGIRLDPTNNNGVYYIDSVVFSKNDIVRNDNWYDVYLDYAVENGIIEKDKFLTPDFKRNVTRREICDMIAAAIPEEHFEVINNVKGISDIDRDEKNADVYQYIKGYGKDSDNSQMKR